MQFLIYIVVVLVSISSILFELDLLTKPKVETRPAAHVASVAPPVPPVAVRKVDGPSVALSPVYPKKPDAEAAPAEAPATAAPAETNGAAPAATAAATTAATAPASEPDKSANKPSILSAPAMTATATPAAATPAPASPAPPATPKPVAAIPAVAKPVAATPAAATPVAQQAQNSCDVAACSSAYQSFRASDCTYQPFEGPRQVCTAPPAGTHKAAAQTQTRKWQADSQSGSGGHQRSKQDELRDVEREVRTITTRDAADDDDMPADDSRVIVQQRGGPRNWRSW